MDLGRKKSAFPRGTAAEKAKKDASKAKGKKSRANSHAQLESRAVDQISAMPAILAGGTLVWELWNESISRLIDPNF